MSAARSCRIECGGVRLHARVRRTDSLAPRRPVVVLHGFTGDAESMVCVSRQLAADTSVARVDLIGHGRSEAPRELALYTMERCAEQVSALMDALALERPHLVGYSMGGRVALALGALDPARVASALVIGTSAGIDDPLERARRRDADEALAARILREGVPAFVEAWMANPLFASQQRLGADALARARRQRLRNRAHGLALSLRGMGTGAQPPLAEALRKLAPPVCFVVGAEDAKFRALAGKLAPSLRDARVEAIPAAGHAAHLENPAAFGRVMRRFHAAVEGREASHSAEARAALT